MNTAIKKQIFARTEKEYESAIRAVKQRVLSISISEKALGKATKDGAAMKLDRINYVTLLALAFDISNIHSNLSKAILSLSKMNRADFKRPSPTPIEKEAIKYNNTNNIPTIRKEITMNENVSIKENAPAPVAERKTSFHLRVSNETYEIIKAKAESYGMSVSNYVEFVISAFDIMELANKVDELNDRIDELAERG